MATLKNLRLLLLAVPLVMQMACSKEEAPTAVQIQTQSKLFFCNIINASSKSTNIYCSASLYSDPAADSSQSFLYINDMLAPTARVEIGALYFSFGIWSSLDFDTAKVRLVSDQGNCSGSILLPQKAILVTPQPNDTLPFTNTLQCIWRKSSNTEWYYYYFLAYPYDSMGNALMSNGGLEGHTYDTTLTIPQSYLSITNASYFNIYFALYSMAGPIPSAGVKGNMIGTINGFLTCQGGNSAYGFYIGTPVGAKTKSMSLKPAHTMQDWYINQLK